MVDEDAIVLLPGTGLVVPIAVAMRLRIVGPIGVRKTQMHDGAELLSAFQPTKRVVGEGYGCLLYTSPSPRDRG